MYSWPEKRIKGNSSCKNAFFRWELQKPVSFWMMVVSILFCVWLGGVAAHASPPRPLNSGQCADFVVHNARIYTSNQHRPFAEAIAVSGKSILEVGKASKVTPFICEKTRVIDAQGALVTAGFIDSHTHAVWLGLLSPILIMIYDATSLVDIKTMIRSYAEQHPELPFIFAIGWKYDYIPNQMPTLEMADEILPDRDLILWSHDGHTGWVNSKALKSMQERNSKAFSYLDPAYDSNQKPTGIFHHFYPINPFDFYTVQEMGGEQVLERMVNGVRTTLQSAISVGVTTLEDVMIHASVFDLLGELNRQGVFSDCRFRGSYFVNHFEYAQDKNQILSRLQQWKNLSSTSTDHYIVGQSVKSGMDGVSPNHTAFLLEPYADDPTNYGKGSYTAEMFQELTGTIDLMRMQIMTHAVGDAAISRVIDGYERTRIQNGPWDSRHRIEHNSMIIDSDIQRMKLLGIHASMQPTHYYGEQSSVTALGEDRFLHMHRIGSLHRAGVPMAFGTDYSIVPFNPLLGILAAMTRITCLGFPTSLELIRERLPFYESVRYYTWGSASAMKMEHMIGSLEAGKRADLVIFTTDTEGIIRKAVEFVMSGDLTDTRPIDELFRLVMVDGKVVFSR